MNKSFPFLAIAMTALVFSCGSKEEEKKDDEAAEAAPPEVIEQETAASVHYDQTGRQEEKLIEKAFAIVNPKGGSEVVGAVIFTEVDGGVKIVADIGGLTPGKHGFHIHEHGDCSAVDASSAGGHFNPTNKKHGGPDSAERHLGDLGNIEANQYGFAHYERIDSDLSLNGEYSIIDKSVVVHEGEDDLTTDPSGNSGKRVACGEIVSTEL